jgi:hypothetical protein
VTGPDQPTPDVAAAGLERALGAQLRAVRGRFLGFGLGWFLASSLLALVLYYFADRGLHLPALVRVVVSAGIAIGLLWGLRQRLWQPLRVPLTRADVALLAERRFPELHQELISALQLRAALAQPAQLRNQSPEMIDAVVCDAAQRLEALPWARVYDARATRRSWALGGLLLLLVGFGAAGDPVGTTTFLWRAFGADVAYPRATTLRVELPSSGPELSVVRAAARAEVTIAAGADLPVLVAVEGVQLRDVWLAVRSSRGPSQLVAMSERGKERFRHVFRRVQQPFTFHATGGDDPEGDLLVAVRVVHPPLVGTIRATLTPPAYTGLEASTVEGGGIEALEGTKAKLLLAATAPVQTAALRFLESGQRIELVPQEIEDDHGRAIVHVGEFTLTKSDRYEVDLIGSNQLRNPHPGHYPVVVLPDQAPAGHLLLPHEEGWNVVLAGGLVAVRVAARDDHRVASVEARLKRTKGGQDFSFPLWQSGTAAEKQLVLSLLIDTTQLPAADQAPGAGESLVLTAEITDHKEPQAQRTLLPSRTVHVVAQDDLQRRIAGHFRRLRDEVDKALAQQGERVERTRELVAELQGDADATDVRNELTVLEVGLNRVRGAADRIHVDLMRAFDVHLLNRLEPAEGAAQALALYREFLQRSSEPVAQIPAYYLELGSRRAAGRIGSMEKVLGPILTMTLAAGRLTQELGPKAARELAEAAVAGDREHRRGRLEATLSTLVAIEQELAKLRNLLDEWNEFQDVVTQTRSVLDRQRDVQNRTRSQIGGRR